MLSIRIRIIFFLSSLKDGNECIKKARSRYRNTQHISLLEAFRSAVGGTVDTDLYMKEIMMKYWIYFIFSWVNMIR